MREAAKLGYGEYRAHLDFMDLAADQYRFDDHAYRRFCETIKDALDPERDPLARQAGDLAARDAQRRAPPVGRIVGLSRRPRSVARCAARLQHIEGRRRRSFGACVVVLSRARLPGAIARVSQQSVEASRGVCAFRPK